MNSLWLISSTLQVYGTLLWLWKRFMTPEVKPTSAFLHLPIDILYSICDELPLSAKILLSQICKPMRHTLHGQCFAQLQAMARKDWCNTLTELADLLPNVYHCMSCDILHPVASHDIPDLTHCWCLRRRCHAVDMSDRLHPQQFYSISLYHVQLALKYSRMKSMHQDYRTNILKQYETRSVGSPVIKTLTAKPKVVNARFVLLATYVLYAGPVRDASTSDWGNYIVFCPHHLLGLSTRGGNEFAAVIQKAAINAETTQGRHTELFSCDRCPTDYSVVVDGDDAVIKAWYDLGNGCSVENSSWQSHFLSARNGRFEGLTVDHEHGSIARMYDSCYE